MLDFDILKEAGTTNDRLREFFTAEMPDKLSLDKLLAAMPSKERKPWVKKKKEDVEQRKKYEERIGSWLQEAIVFSLSNHHIYSAVDLAWDSTPINKTILPLMLYAQGRIDFTKAASALKDLPDSQKYVKKNDRGEVTSIDLPKFFDCNVNLIRSVVTRRLAAQTNKYNNLYPFFKFEGRSKSQVAKLRADGTSERMDIMADQYDYRRAQEQEGRDTMLFGHDVAFPRCAWERETQWERRPVAPEFVSEDGKIPKVARIVKEGVCFVNPHPSRVIWDNNSPLASLNTDTGCEWAGFWDVTRYRNVAENPSYFNRKAVTFGPNAAVWFTAYTTYFTQHFDKIVPPSLPVDSVGLNDRKSNVGLYTGEMADAAVFFTHLYVKETPQAWGWGDYPYPVWVHLAVAGDHTVIHAEIMPSMPAAVGSFNESDNRLVNISLAHELMSYQDQLTNLYTQFLETLKTDMFAVAVINTDIFPDDDDGKKALAEFKKVMSGNNFYAGTQILMASFGRAQQLLGQSGALSADNIFKIVRSAPNEKLAELLKAIASPISLAERMVWMRPHEQGQPVSHEITARETHAMSGTTDDMRNFFSDAMDAMRSAKKKICYESWMACGSDQVELSVINRYPKSVIEKAGLAVVDEDGDGDLELANGLPSKGRYVRLMGSKRALQHDYIFTTRDGSERSADTKAATVLVELLRALSQMPPEITKAIIGGMGREKLYEIINEIFRMADASIDLKLELKPGDDDALLIEDDEQVMALIEKMAQAVQKNTADLAALQQMIQQMLGPQLAPAPGAAMAPAVAA